MANEWLRLWHDMPTDPKFRTIAKKSGQTISEVMAVYMHLLVSASRNVTRGHADVTAEDIASAIDVTEESVQSIFDAMQGRVLDGFYLTGWEKRQPKREDHGSVETGAKSAAERKREERARKGLLKSNEPVTLCHAMSRNVTTDKDKDKDKEENITPIASQPSSSPVAASENKKSSKTFRKWLEAVKASGESPIPSDDPIFQYAADAGLPDDFLRLHWIEFRARYVDDDKRYTDWRRVFRKSARGNWFKLWWINNGQYTLTTLGQQAMSAMQAKEKREP